MMPSRHQSQYVPQCTIINPDIGRSAVFGLSNQFGSRLPYPEAFVHQSSINLKNIETFNKKSTFVYVPDSTEGSELSLDTNSPTSVSSNSLKFYSAAGSIGQSQSSLIMPNLFTIFNQGSKGSSNKKEPTWSKNASCKSLASLTKETIDFPQPLLRKCNTSVSLSSSTIPVAIHTVISENSMESVNTTSSPSRASALVEYVTVKSSNKKNKKKLQYIPDKTKSFENIVEPIQEKACCSRCSSNTSLNHCGKDALGGCDVHTIYCNMCYDYVSIKDMYQIQQCQCSFCIYCMKMYLMLKIQDGQIRIPCPDFSCECDGELTIEDVKNLLSEKFIKLFLKHQTETEVDLDPSKVWCPTPGCETVVHLERSIVPDRDIPATCPSCQLKFCTTCSSGWTATHSCNSVTKKLKDLIKRCPRCEILIERDAGCAQMQCKKCKHVFCWYCLTSLEDDFFLRHFDKGACKNKLGHSRASVLWHRAQVITIFTTVGIIMIAGFPILLLLGPCLLCRRCCINSCLSADQKECYYNV